VKNTITVISGEPSAGKTTLALYLGSGIATGAEILGGRCERHPCLFITKENPSNLPAML